ncbi:MAG: hypothetical protein ACK46X_01350 [Candidatus Sericytochromatia bacterium]
MPKNQDNQDNPFNDVPYDQPYATEDQMDYSAYAETAEEEDESEDFPEPDRKAAKAKPNVALIGGAVLGALAIGLAGTFVLAPEMLRDSLPEEVVAMLPEGTLPAAEPEPTIEPIRPKKRKPAPAADQAIVPPAEENPAKPADQSTSADAPFDAPAEPDAQSAEFQAPAESAPAKPKPPAAKPAAEAPKPKPKATPMAAAPKPAQPKVAAKPQPVAAKQASGGQVMGSTAIAFAPHSYWVAAAEVEKLWAISAKAGTSGGTFVVTTHRGQASDEGELVGKRTEKLVEMLRRNNRPLGHEVQVRTGSPVSGATGHASVTFVKQL